MSPTLQRMLAARCLQLPLLHSVHTHANARCSADPCSTSSSSGRGRGSNDCFNPSSSGPEYWSRSSSRGTRRCSSVSGSRRGRAAACASTSRDGGSPLTSTPETAAGTEAAVAGAAASGAELITSPANSSIKHCVKLRESARYRAQQGRVLLVGAPLLSELAEARQPQALEAHVLFLREGSSPVLHAGIKPQRCVRVTDAVMKKLCGVDCAEGVDALAEVAMPPPLVLEGRQQVQRPPETRGGSGGDAASACLRRLLVLEGVQDPGNLGTLLRCALAFGWDAVWLLHGCCDPFNDKALRASRGAALRLPLAYGGWDELADAAAARGMLLLAAEPEEGGKGVAQQAGGQDAAAASAAGAGGQDAAAASAAGAGPSIQGAQPLLAHEQPVCLVLGTEGQGLSQRALGLCRPVTIPMQGAMESLNVGIAGGILMFALSEGLPQLLGRLAELQRDDPQQRK